MKKEESDIIWMFIIAIAGAVLICLAFSYFSEKRLDNSETIEASGIVVAKQSEQESIGRFGDFRTNYYLLFDSGEIREVDLKEYMEFNVGDTLTWHETVYGNKEQ